MTVAAATTSAVDSPGHGSGPVKGRYSMRGLPRTTTRWIRGMRHPKPNHGPRIRRGACRPSPDRIPLTDTHVIASGQGDEGTAVADTGSASRSAVLVVRHGGRSPCGGVCPCRAARRADILLTWLPGRSAVRLCDYLALAAIGDWPTSEGVRLLKGDDPAHPSLRVPSWAHRRGKRIRGPAGVGWVAGAVVGFVGVAGVSVRGSVRGVLLTA